MRYPFEFSIKKQIVFFSVMILCFFVLIIGVFYWDILYIEKKLSIMEHFSNIQLDALEIRRYEKDILLRVGQGNLESLKKYIARLKQEIEAQKDEMIKITSEFEYASFVALIQKYERLFLDYERTGRLNPVQVREYGKEIVNFCNRLLQRQKDKIHKELKYLLWSFSVLPALLMIILLATIQFQIRPVINRLKLLEKATHDLLEDRFTPIEDNQQIKDEVSDLISAFNKMGQELKMRNEEVLQAKKMAAIGTFSSGIAHEINNPLNNISLSADLLAEEYENLSPEEAREIIADIMEQTERASRIVRNLLDFSRAKEPTIKPVRICDVVSKTRKLIANELMIKQIYFGKDIPDDLPPVLGDEDKLQQVFLNLFINAIQAMDEGGILFVDARQEPEGFIRVDVTDSGKGIPQELKDKIFEPFFTTKEVGKGTGLGLSIVYGIVRKHGGHVEVRSEPGSGTTFSLFFPVYNPEEDGSDGHEGGDNRRREDRQEPDGEIPEGRGFSD